MLPQESRRRPAVANPFSCGAGSGDDGHTAGEEPLRAEDSEIRGVWLGYYL